MLPLTYIIPLTVSGVVVLIYDALLTLNEELNFIWVPILQKIKLDGMTKLRVHRPVLLYLLARYFMLIISMIYLNGRRQVLDIGNQFSFDIGLDLFPLRSLTDNWVGLWLFYANILTLTKTTASPYNVSPFSTVTHLK